MARFRHEVVPELYLLDGDTAVSSGYLTDKDLERNIKNSIKILGSCILYLLGIRKIGTYKQYDRGYIESIFDGYPSRKLPEPKFSAKVEFKYVRQCRNHFMYVLDIGKSASIEYGKRYKKEHNLNEELDWYIMNVPKRLPLVKTPLPFPIKALPLRYRVSGDIVTGMRSYYINRYRPIALESYKMASVPEWFGLRETDIVEIDN